MLPVGEEEIAPLELAALLHDIGDTLAPYNHPDVAAAIVKPFVSEANHWMVAHHGIFQGYYFSKPLTKTDYRAFQKDRIARQA